MSTAVPPSAQVSALPIGSGGSNETKKQLNDIHTNLTMMSVQSVADQKYDPETPPPVKPSVIKEAFCSLDPLSPSTLSPVVAVVGLSLVLYGLFSK